MIIGERKCGTSSLYRYLITHPEILPARQKETAFFSNPGWYVKRHFDQYLDYFPSKDQETITMEWPELQKDGSLSVEEVIVPIDAGGRYITGEASANVFSTVSPGKIKQFFPDMRFIVMVREPVVRAISQHAMYRRYKQEGRAWSWLVGQWRRDLKLEYLVSKLGIAKGPFLSPGKYINNFNRWFRHFDRSQFFVVRTEDMGNPDQAKVVLNDLCKFLEVAPYDFGEVLLRRFNRSVANHETNAAREMLGDFFTQSNRELEHLLGRKLW